MTHLSVIDSFSWIEKLVKTIMTWYSVIISGHITFWYFQFFQVCSCVNCYVQCVWSDWKIHSTLAIPEVGVQNNAHRSHCLSPFVCASILFYCKVWHTGLDDNADILSGVIQWLPHCLCSHCSTRRLQGGFVKQPQLFGVS